MKWSMWGFLRPSFGASMFSAFISHAFLCSKRMYIYSFDKGSRSQKHTIDSRSNPGGSVYVV